MVTTLSITQWHEWRRKKAAQIYGEFWLCLLLSVTVVFVHCLLICLYVHSARIGVADPLPSQSYNQKKKSAAISSYAPLIQTESTAIEMLWRFCRIWCCRLSISHFDLIVKNFDWLTDWSFLLSLGLLLLFYQST